MSHRRFAMDTSGGDSILSRAKLLNVSSAKYGGDWHSVPHTHSYAELYAIHEQKPAGDGEE